MADDVVPCGEFRVPSLLLKCSGESIAVLSSAEAFLAMSFSPQKIVRDRGGEERKSGYCVYGKPSVWVALEIPS